MSLQRRLRRLHELWGLFVQNAVISILPPAMRLRRRGRRLAMRRSMGRRLTQQATEACGTAVGLLIGPWRSAAVKKLQMRRYERPRL